MNSTQTQFSQAEFSRHFPNTHAQMQAEENRQDAKLESQPPEKKKSEAFQEAGNIGAEKEHSYHYFRTLREQYVVQFNKTKALSFLDYIQSLDLDPKMCQTVQKKKLGLSGFVYFFDIALENNAMDQNTTEKTTMKWELRRRFEDFVQLDKSLNEELIKGSKMLKAALPQLSSFYDLKSEGAPENFIAAAEQYIRALLGSAEVRSKTKLFYDFLEFSLLPLVNNPQKYKEGLLRKKGGGRFKRNKVKLYCSVFFTNWQRRYFILTEEGIIYTLDSDTTKAREMLLFDQSFQIEYGKKVSGSKIGIALIYPNRRLELEAGNIFEALEWIGAIQRAAKASPYTKINRFLSFAPVREPTHQAKWYVDSIGYFEELHACLLQAKQEVFITDWWLSPELTLKVPVQDGDSEFRLDKTLAKVANSGVKVYVIVYHEVKLVCYNDSEHTKKSLESLSPNITVLRHPSEPFFSWSHHEKLVVIDQTIGFIGGLDLCFGRVDTSDHPIYDPAFVAGTGHTYLGKEYSNPRLADFRNCREHDVALIDKATTPRMPFHDAMIKLIGPVVGDISRHFIQYWNHVEVDVYGKEEEVPLPKAASTIILDEEEAKRENASLKFKSAFRKIFGMRRLMGDVYIDPMPDEEIAKAQAEDIDLNMDGSAPKKPPVLGENERQGTLRDGIKAIIAANKAAKENVLVEKHEEPSSQPNTYDKLDPNTGNPRDTLLTGKNGNMREMRASDRICEENKEDRSVVVNTYKKRPLIMPSSKRQIQTMNEIGYPQPLNTSVKTKDDQAYKDNFAKLLKGIREKEKDYESEMSRSGDKKSKVSQFVTHQHKHHVLHKAEDKENASTNLNKDQGSKLILTQANKPGTMSQIPSITKTPTLNQVPSQNKIPSMNQLPAEVQPKPKPSLFAQKQKETKKLDKRYSDSFSGKNMLQVLFSSKEKMSQGTCQVQMVRSASKWSMGLNANDGNLENSIQNAYIELIQNSKRFIYIENQFFMSSTAGKTLKNEVAQALVYRIELAHVRGERFRVIVYLPLLPAFEGDVVDSKAALLRLQIYWQFMTISRGGDSIYEQLRHKGINPEEYIQFFALRNHARMMNGQPATELIYIHSKIMIVDDEVVLIGSANINDRSLQGSRDSEIAMVIEDTKKVPSFMNGEAIEVNEFAHTFRKRLMAEHLGFTDEQVVDPLTDEFIYKMSDIAEANTSIYREVFACYPDDNMRTLAQIDIMKANQSLNKYDELIPGVKGHTVWFPLDFLADENLRPPKTTMEYYISDSTFV